MALIGPSEYAAIRAAISTDLDEGDLPDDIIALDMYIGEANRWAPSVITVSGAEATGNRAKSAAIYMAAALLTPAVAQVLSQKDSTGETVTLKAFDPVLKEEKLRERAAEMILLVNGNAESIQRRPSAAVRPMKSHVSICSIHCCNRSVCGCSLVKLVF